MVRTLQTASASPAGMQTGFGGCHERGGTTELSAGRENDATGRDARRWHLRLATPLGSCRHRHRRHLRRASIIYIRKKSQPFVLSLAPTFLSFPPPAVRHRQPQYRRTTCIPPKQHCSTKRRKDSCKVHVRVLGECRAVRSSRHGLRRGFHFQDCRSCHTV